MSVAEALSIARPGLPNEQTASLQFNEMVADFYDGPLNQEASWERSLDAVRRFFRANFAVLIVRSPQTGGGQASPFGAGFTLTYSGVRQVPNVSETYSNLYAVDLFVNLPADRAVTVRDFVSEEDWLDHAFYQQFLAPMNVFHVLGIDTCTASGGGCQLRICRERGAAAFSERDKRFLELFAVHMKRCLALHARQHEARSANQLIANAFERLLYGWVLLDQDGLVLRMNSVAEDTFARRDGLALTGQRVHALQDSENKTLKDIVARVLAKERSQAPNLVEAISISRPHNDCPLGVLVRRVAAESWVDGDRRACAVLLFRDPSRTAETSQEAIRRLFGFTPAEAGLAMILAEGRTLDEAAGALNVSMNTVRTHLKSMFLKTGTARQTDLVRMLLGSVATIC